MQGVSYAQFLIPGLIMLQVIDSSYGECSSSLFQGRFMNSIQELLIAPMSAFEMVGGVHSGQPGALAAHRRTDHAARRRCWCTAAPHDWVLYFAVIALVSVLFSALGSDLRTHRRQVRSHRDPDDVRHHAADLRRRRLHRRRRCCRRFCATFELFNPIFYTIDAFRRSYTGESYLAPGLLACR